MFYYFLEAEDDVIMGDKNIGWLLVFVCGAVIVNAALMIVAGVSGCHGDRVTTCVPGPVVSEIKNLDGILKACVCEGTVK